MLILQDENQHLHVIVVGVGPQIDPGIGRVISKEDPHIFVKHKDNVFPFSEFDQLSERIRELSYNECMGYYQRP